MVIRNEYPRPQQQRKNWFTLNGEWEFCFDDADIGLKEGYALGNKAFDKKINVPFAYQCKESGIGDETVHEIMWYKKEFVIDGVDTGRLLCFNGVDYIADVYLNGALVGHHEGGYAAFDIDVTKIYKER